MNAVTEWILYSDHYFIASNRQYKMDRSGNKQYQPRFIVKDDFVKTINNQDKKLKLKLKLKHIKSFDKREKTNSIPLHFNLSEIALKKKA